MNTNNKILLVEDDKDTVRAMAVRFRTKGYQLVVANDGVSAISAARKEKPDLIVLDLGLPGGDGFVVMQRLKANYELMLVPVISGKCPRPRCEREACTRMWSRSFFPEAV
ncbi:MAG: hypothetical protein DMG32_05640 [Acidobacteria bacterium]|nr:MAG: hypothetical protein DMG32_05640 [Acidobacteriota bacterium]